MIGSVICDLLGVKYPILQGGMAWISDARLVSAVSNAGGLGVIAAGNAPGDWVREQIIKTKELTNKPFAVNIMLLSPYAEEAAKIVCDEKAPVVITGAGNPSRFMNMWLNAGIKVLPVVASAALAKIMQRVGAAAVVAEGSEAGGHIGELNTMTLVPQVVDAVSIPVIAAGGIADGRGFAAAFMLGAQGVQVGTRFLTAYECNIHQNYKDRVIKAKDIDTISTGKRLGHPVRSLKTPFSRAFYEMEYDSSVTNDELEKMGEGALRLAAVEGDIEKGCFMAGQSAGLVKKEQSAEEIIQEIYTEGIRLLKGITE